MAKTKNKRNNTWEETPIQGKSRMKDIRKGDFYNELNKKLKPTPLTRPLPLDPQLSIISRQQPRHKDDKRKLLDLCLAGPVLAMDEKVRQKFYLTKNFVLDASASRFMGELVAKVAPQMLDQHRWARGPYPLCWIEFDHPAYWEGLGMPPGGDPHTRDDRVGILWDHGLVHMVTSADVGVGCAVHTFEFGRPMSLEEELEIAEFYGFSRLVTRMEMLGTSASLTDGWWRSESFKSIFRENTIRLTSWGKKLRADPRVTINDRRKILGGNAGDLKLTIVLLLLVCRPHKMLTLSEVSHERRLVKGKAVTLKAHSVITMRAEHSEPVKRFIKSFHSGIHRQRHDVRGHWAQSRRLGSLSCEHAFEPTDVDHFECLKCGAKRWWRRSHVRGERQLGVKTASYEVKR